MQIINFNFFQLLILFGSIQGLIFSLTVFLVKKYRSKSGFFLGLSVLFLSISNIQHIFMDVGYFSETSLIRTLYIPWHWLVAPLFYIFVHHFLQKEIILKRQWFYLIGPFLVITLIHLAQLIYKAKIDKNHTISIYYQQGIFLYTNLFSFLYNSVIIYFMYKMIITYESKRQETIEKIKKETFWLKNLIHIGIGILSLGTISGIIGVQYNMQESFYAYPFFISLSLWIYWVGYVGVNRSSSYKRLEKLNISKGIKKTGFTTFDKINLYIIEEKKYLAQDINQNVIAEKFDISNGHLSKLINEHTEKKFNDYINEFRVNTSKKMLTDQAYNNYTIESIGLECGFKSKSNFYTAFKKFTGQTPNQYKKLNK